MAEMFINSTPFLPGQTSKHQLALINQFANARRKWLSKIPHTKAILLLLQLLKIDPSNRATAHSALKNEFFEE